MKLHSNWLFAATILLGTFVAHAEEPVSFRSDVAPVLLEKCVACHGPKKAEGGYRADSYSRAMQEGDSFMAGFAPGSLDESEALRRIMSDDVGERMPLDADPLPAEQIALIRRWVEEGAKFDGEKPDADLVAIIPPRRHPDPPDSYPFTLPVTALAFSSDGQQLIVSGYHELTVWNPENGQLLRRIPNVGQRTYAIEFSPDGKTLAVACGAPGRLGETRLFDPATGKLRSVLGATSDVVLDLAFSPSGERLAVASADGLLRVFDGATGDQQMIVSSHSDWVTAVAWNADGSKIASASRDKTAKVIDAQTGELLVTYSGHGEPVRGVAFQPGGAEVYSSGGDNRIHRWKIDDGKKSAEVRFGGEVFKLPTSGEFLFATSADKTVRQFEAASQKQIHSLGGHQDWALSVDFHPATQRIASGGFDGEVRIWNAADGSLVTTFLAAPGRQAEAP